MGLNKTVDFSTAKLLKEKGFGLNNEDYIQLPRFYEKCGNYIEYNVHVIKKYNSPPNHLGADTIEDFEANLTMVDNSLDSIYLAPTISEVVMWLYEKHGIWLVINITITNKWYFELFNLKGKRNAEIETIGKYFNSPMEAYKAAITYTLNNLL